MKCSGNMITNNSSFNNTDVYQKFGRKPLTKSFVTCSNLSIKGKRLSLSGYHNKANTPGNYADKIIDGSWRYSRKEIKNCQLSPLDPNNDIGLHMQGISANGTNIEVEVISVLVNNQGNPVDYWQFANKMNSIPVKIRNLHQIYFKVLKMHDQNGKTTKLKGGDSFTLVESNNQKTAFINAGGGRGVGDIIEGLHVNMDEEQITKFELMLSEYNKMKYRAHLKNPFFNN